MVERMKIEEENADKVYNGLVLGPNKTETTILTSSGANIGTETSGGLK